MRKFHKFFSELTWFASYSRQTLIRNSIKRKLGHSTKNHRTLTVRQAIDHLNSAYKPTMAKDIEQVYNLLKPKIKSKRTRTDAIDLSELVSTYRTVVMKNKKLRRQIGSILNN